jgi:hypothetical protein
MYIRRPSLSRRAAHDATNREAARVILSDVAKHGGSRSLSVQWAQRFVARVGAEAAEQDAPAPMTHGQQSLQFAEAAQ